MAEELESLTLVYLRRLDAKVDRLGTDMIEVKSRLSALEAGEVSLRREIVGVQEAIVGLQFQVDRLGARVERIERRLDIYGT